MKPSVFLFMVLISGVSALEIEISGSISDNCFNVKDIDKLLATAASSASTIFEVGVVTYETSLMTNNGVRMLNEDDEEGKKSIRSDVGRQLPIKVCYGGTFYTCITRQSAYFCNIVCPAHRRMQEMAVTTSDDFMKMASLLQDELRATTATSECDPSDIVVTVVV
jgi:hypothetical protein